MSNGNTWIYYFDDNDEPIKEPEDNGLCQLRYCLLTAGINCGIHEHPQTQMKKLGYTVTDAIPQSIADCWWFTVDKFIEPLPPYLKKIHYTPGQP